MLILELLQLLEQHIEVVVAYNWRVKHIISVVMLVEFTSQLKYTFLWGHKDCLI